MPLSIYTLKILALAETLHRWMAVLTGLDGANRARVADYAEAIAATLSRAAAALDALDRAPEDAATRALALKELGRIVGYVETMVAVLEQHLDGRKIAGIKRRLDGLGADRLAAEIASAPTDAPESQRPSRRPRPPPRSTRLLAAEGYIRALADGLRA